MTEPDDLTARLDALGGAEPPAPHDDFVAGLTAGRLVHRLPERPRRRLPVVLPAVAVAAAVLGFVLLAFGGSDPASTVTIQTAADASIQLDDGARPASAGQSLIEGTHVITGPSGHVTVGGDTLGPNQVGVVRAGRLRRLRRAIAEARSTTTTTEAPTTTTVASPTPTTAAPTATTTTSVPPALERLPVAVTLEGRRWQDGSVGLRWTEYGGADFGGYVVFREDRTVVARRAAVDGVRAIDRTAPAEPTRYVVVVFDTARHPVARSQPIRL